MKPEGAGVLLLRQGRGASEGKHDAPSFQLVEVQNHGIGVPGDADVKSERGTRRDGALQCERAAASSGQGDRDCAIRVLCCLHSDAPLPGSGKAARARVGEVGRPRGFDPVRYSPLVGTSFHPMVHPSSPTRPRPSRATRRRSRPAPTRATTRRAVRATRPIRPAIIASVGRTDGPPGWRRTEARVSKSEHNAIEVNLPDYRLDHPGTPMRREEVKTPFRAPLNGSVRRTLAPTWAQVDQRKSQKAVARFKDDRPRADLARIAPQVRRLPSCRSPASLAGEHGGWA